MGNFFFRLYKALLWFFGFAAGEYITYMIRRQEERLGVWWWLMVVSTQTACAILYQHYLGQWLYVLLLVATNAMVGVLLWHITDKPSKS